MSGRYICEKCLTRYEDGAECPSCEGEPLLDLQDPAVVEYLVELDDKERRKKALNFTALAAVLWLPIMGLAAYLIPADWVGRKGETRFELAIGVFLMGVLALDGVLLAIFPPRRRVPPEGF